MTQRAPTPGQKALAHLLKGLEGSVGKPDKELKASSLALQRTHRSLEARFDARATEQAKVASKLLASMDVANKNMQAMRTGLVAAKKTGDPSLIAQAEANLTVVQCLHSVVTSMSQWAGKTVANDPSDDFLRTWYDRLVVLVAESAEDNTGKDKAIFLISSAALVGGLATGPAGALSAAGISAVLLVVDLVTKLQKAKARDDDNAWLEAADLMVKAANMLGEQWLTILLVPEGAA